MKTTTAYPLRRRVTTGITLPVLLSSLLLTGCDNGKSVDSPKYRDIARSFSLGVVALQVRDETRAPNALTQVTTLAPDEPTGWANLGVLQLRQGQLEPALASLKKAQELAPQNSRILTNIGLVETRRGKFAEAVTALKQAVALDPDNLRAIFALSKAVAQQGAPDADTEVDQLLGQILQKQPDNLVVLLELTRTAAKRGDKAALTRFIGELTKRSASWPTDAKSQLATLTKAAEGNPRAAAPEVIRLGNWLKTVVTYRQSNDAVEGNTEQAGLVLEQMLKYPAANNTPAPADTGLTYTVQAVADAGTGAFVHAVSATGEGKPTVKAQGSTFAPLDFDYDFQTDLATAGPSGFHLLKGNKDDSYTDVTGKTGLPASVTKAAYTGVWAADVDTDGDLDIVLGMKDKGVIVLQNNGDGTFKAIQPFPNVPGAVAFAWGDIDGDGDPDALFIDETGKLLIYTNERNGLFAARQAPAGLESVSAVTLADLSNDGKLDIVALKPDGTVVRASDEGEGKSFTVAEVVKTTASQNVRLFVGDFDNNGTNDLAVTDGTQTQVYLSDVKGVFAATPVQTVALGTQDIADVNGDGILDLVGLASEKATEALGQGKKGYHALTIRPRAKETKGDQRINSFGIGGEIAIRAGLLTQKQPITSPVVHFGLGDQTVADYARIVWPNGTVQGEFELKGDAAMLAEQRLKGSCPFLFVWDGSKMSFVTDCIWRSPLGLKINAQATAGVMMTEDWVKIRGDQMQPRTDADGKSFYDMRITADLWETHFFDHLALMPVDHPRGTEIWVDERFSVPPPPLTIITTTPVTPIARATADTGEDMTEILKTRDGVYADYFGRGKYQGVTRDHTLTLDLGTAAKNRSGPLYLIAHGWIHPTDTSINVAMGQGKNPPPMGLSLEVPDGRGGWRTAKAGLGFPTGKVKTVVLRIDDILNGGTQLRLRTNLEIYWDSIGSARGITNAPLQKEKLLPETATLRYRGFTTVQANDKSSPELPVGYEPVVSHGQRWRDLVGYYTRFGDVRELLNRVDDRYIIMNAGDEIRMRFAVPAPPKPGFVRDYILIGDGWVKDGDLNTQFSATVLPLPTHANPDYSVRPTTLSADPVYQRHKSDWDTYHTRFVAPDAFRDTLTGQPSP